MIALSPMASRVARGLRGLLLHLQRSWHWASSQPVSFLPLAPDADWTEQGLGHVVWGYRRLDPRLVAITTQAARLASPTAEGLADDGLGRESGYDFFENGRVSLTDIARAHHRDTARRCAAHPFVFCAIGGGGLRFDGTRSPRSKRVKGLRTMLGLAAAADGTPLGLLGLRLWAHAPKAPRRRRTQSAENAGLWRDVATSAVDALTSAAPDCRLWFQLDVENDTWSPPREAEALAREGHWVTLRARAEEQAAERLDDQSDGEQTGGRFEAPGRALGETTHVIDVPVGPGRTARRAHLTLRFYELAPGASQPGAPRAWAVLAQERQSTTPTGEAPVCWRLLTTCPVEGAEDARRVVDGYGQLWQVEHLHDATRARGATSTSRRLEGRAQPGRSATSSLALAVRVLRLVHLARKRPDQPATAELTSREVRALRERKLSRRAERAALTVGEAVGLLAELGVPFATRAPQTAGYRALTRGLYELRPLVRTIAFGE